LRKFDLLEVTENDVRTMSGWAGSATLDPNSTLKVTLAGDLSFAPRNDELEALRLRLLLRSDDFTPPLLISVAAEDDLHGCGNCGFRRYVSATATVEAIPLTLRLMEDCDCDSVPGGPRTSWV
jgi:hypothetical protein